MDNVKPLNLEAIRERIPSPESADQQGQETIPKIPFVGSLGHRATKAGGVVVEFKSRKITDEAKDSDTVPSGNGCNWGRVRDCCSRCSTGGTDAVGFTG